MEYTRDNLQDVIFWGVASIVIVLVLMTDPAQLLFISLKSWWNALFSLWNPSLAKNFALLAKYSTPFQEPYYSLKEARQYYDALSRQTLPFRTALFSALSFLAAGRIGRKVFSLMNQKAAQELEVVGIICGRGSELEKAKKVLALISPEHRDRLEGITTFQEFLALYREVRQHKNVPNNLIARCFRPNTEERFRILDVGRQKKTAGFRSR